MQAACFCCLEDPTCLLCHCSAGKFGLWRGTSAHFEPSPFRPPALAPSRRSGPGSSAVRSWPSAAEGNLASAAMVVSCVRARSGAAAVAAVVLLTGFGGTSAATSAPARDAPVPDDATPSGDLRCSGSQHRDGADVRSGRYSWRSPSGHEP